MSFTGVFCRGNHLVAGYYVDGRLVAISVIGVAYLNLYYIPSRDGEVRVKRCSSLVEAEEFLAGISLDTYAQHPEIPLIRDVALSDPGYPLH